MSGFAGFVHKSDRPVASDLLPSMGEAMRCFAPDGIATWRDGLVGLTHALLAIAPHDRDHVQPLSRDRLTIAGDIRLDRRADLAAALGEGPNDSDAELVLAAYRRWGEKCVERMEGEFAFAIWDETRRSLYCARDPVGLVPFYFAELQDGLVFGNAIRAILAHPEVDDALNLTSVADHLLFGFAIARDASLFTVVKPLLPAHCLTWRDGAWSVRRWWSWQPVEPLFLDSDQAYADRFRNLLDAAIAERLRGRHAAAHVSGGMDSSSIAVIAHRRMVELGGEPLAGYCVSYRDLRNENEGVYARQVAELAGFPLEELVGDDLAIADPLPAGGFMPGPLIMPGQDPMWDISRRASSAGAREIFGGQTGDALFMPPPGAARSPAGRLRAAAARTRGRARLLTGFWRDGKLIDHLRFRFSRRGPIQSPPAVLQGSDLFDRRLSEAPAAFRQVTGSGLAAMFDSPGWTLLATAAHPSSTALPIRTRLPFFDLALLRFAAGIPDARLLENKAIFRRAMAGDLPRALLRRPKSPLGPPPHVEVWRRARVHPWARALLLADEVAPYLDRRRVEALLDERAEPDRAEAATLMAAMRLSHWLGQRRRRP